MASLVYNRAKKEMWDGTIDLINDTIKVLLLDGTTTTPEDATKDFVSEINTDEFSDTNYTGGFGGGGRKTLGTKAITEDDTNDRAEFDAADITWTSLGGTDSVVAAVIFAPGTADSDSVLIAYIDIADTATNGGDFTLQWDAEGIIQLS